MLRICLCLLIVVASSTVAAREIKLSSANSGSCPEESSSTARESSRATPRAPAPARELKAKPTVHSDASSTGRMQSPRWHSFLPGMFR